MYSDGIRWNVLMIHARLLAGCAELYTNYRQLDQHQIAGIQDLVVVFRFHPKLIR